MNHTSGIYQTGEPPLNSIYLEALDEYKNLAGESYRDEIYPTKSSIPAHLLKVVSKLKASDAHAKQANLHFELQKYKTGSVVNISSLPPERKNIIQEFESLSAEIQKWEEIYRSVN